MVLGVNIDGTSIFNLNMHIMCCIFRHYNDRKENHPDGLAVRERFGRFRLKLLARLLVSLGTSRFSLTVYSTVLQNVHGPLFKLVHAKPQLSKVQV